MKKNASVNQQKTDWDHLDSLSDNDIDYTDIPEIDDVLFEQATFIPGKQTVTIRLDNDVVAWLKQNGRGYQTRANKILRTVMERGKKVA